MQAVILAAGKGTRMKELTAETPKPLLEVAGKTLLEHKFDELPETVDEVILVIGYQGDKIRARLGDHYGRLTLTYVVQDELNGTMGALACAKNLLTDRFIVMMGDDLYAKADVEAAVASPEWAMLVSPTDSMGSGGKVITDEAGTVIAIEEGSHVGQKGCMNTNLFVLDKKVFDHPMVPKEAGSVEYGLPQTILPAAAAAHMMLHAVNATAWIQVTAPEDLAKAEEILTKI
jgi:bifunctional UDP-N-acetylglucosamine pyrophosphorylase/glucosamine-1-phosphate N-acetyltransferase